MGASCLIPAMGKKSVDCSDGRDLSSTTTASEFQRISLTIQCSARKSKWTSKITSLCRFSKLGKHGIPAGSASLRVKLPRAVLKLSLAARSIVCTRGSSCTIRKTFEFFGTLKTRKKSFRVRACLTKLKEKTFLRDGCDSDGGISRKDSGSVQHRELVEQEQQKEPFVKSTLELARSCWQGQLCGFLGLLGNLFRFPIVKERRARAVQAGVVISTLILLGQLLGIMSSAAFWATASAFLAALVVNFFNINNNLSAAFWELWGKLSASEE